MLLPGCKNLLEQSAYVSQCSHYSQKFHAILFEWFMFLWLLGTAVPCLWISWVVGDPVTVIQFGLKYEGCWVSWKHELVAFFISQRWNMRGENIIPQNKYKANSHPKASGFRISPGDWIIWRFSSGLNCCFHSHVRTFISSYFIGLVIYCVFIVFFHSPHRTDKFPLWVCAAIRAKCHQYDSDLFFLILIYATNIISLYWVRKAEARVYILIPKLD